MELMSSTTASVTIDELREMFSTHDILGIVVSNKGAQFTLAEFHNFLKSNAIRKVLIASYPPSGNRQAERMVQTTKRFCETHATWKLGKIY